MNLTNPSKCVFWQPERYVHMYKYACCVILFESCFMQRNSWSDEGISTIRVGHSVECRATHLTSFAVLVDTQSSTTTTTSAASVIVQCKWTCVNDSYIHHFRLYQLLATLAVLYQCFLYLLPCLQSCIGGMFMHNSIVFYVEVLYTPMLPSFNTYACIIITD